MKNNTMGFAITALYIFLMLTLFPVPASAQNNFTNKLDSMGFSPSMMDFYNYYTNGLAESHITIRPPILIMDDIWSYPDDRKREFGYDENQNLVSNHIFKKSPDAEVWEPQQQQLYTYDETNLLVSGEFREWDETNSSWEEDPFEGYYNTFNDDGLIIQKLWKSSLYSDDYVVETITVNTYNADNNLSQIHFKRFSPTSGLVIYEQYSYYEYLANGNVEISVTKRESDSGPFVLHEVIDEEYVDFNTIQTITRFNDGQPYLHQRITKYESFLGDYGGQRNEDYVDGSWEIQFENRMEFYDEGNRHTQYGTSLNNQTGVLDTTSFVFYDYDMSGLMENCASPFHIYGWSDFINLPVSKTQYEYESGTRTDTIISTYYYSDFVLSSSPDLRPSEITMFPNPSQDEIRFTGMNHSEPIYVSVFDIQGRVVLRALIFSSDVLNVSSLKSGLYNVSLTHKGTRETKMLVVK